MKLSSVAEQSANPLMIGTRDMFTSNPAETGLLNRMDGKRWGMRMGNEDGE